jgi:redox-sensitive bicupin YhaK (pirin superfamily)
MPEFRRPEEMAIDDGGEGWALSTLADSSQIEGLGMVARRWALGAGARSPRRRTYRGAECFLYVIQGEGAAVIGGDRLRLDRESVVWLEPDDAYSLEAGPGGLEVLEARSD